MCDYSAHALRQEASGYPVLGSTLPSDGQSEGSANLVCYSLTLCTFRSNILALRDIAAMSREHELGYRAEYTTSRELETLFPERIAGSVDAGRRGGRSRCVLSILRK